MSQGCSSAEEDAIKVYILCCDKNEPLVQVDSHFPLHGDTTGIMTLLITKSVNYHE